MGQNPVIQQEMFIIYPYLGAQTLVMNVHLVVDSSLPFRAFNYNVTNFENK